jgi:dTDP-4-amino-4,6-dideoxygalactose transaminase/nucleoside-diphosphate-sugar epimerase
MKQKILVTGGAGYIGSFVVNNLLDKGHEVVVLDSLIYGDEGLQSFIHRKGVRFIKGDVSDPAAVEASLQGIDKVIALAAIVGDPACSVNEEMTWKINYESVKLLTDLSIKKGVSRIVFASSCSTYGSNEKTKYLTEGSELNPVSLYAKTRILSEEYLLEKKHLISPVILRLSTVFGLSPRMRFDLAINIMTAKAVTDQSIEVFGGKQWRPFVHVWDVANAFVTAMEAPDQYVKGEIFNVGSTDSNYQIDDVAKIIAEEVPGTQITDHPTMVDPRNYNVIFDKIHKKLNFKTLYSVRDGVREIAEFMREENPDISEKKYSNYAVWKELGKVEKFVPYAAPDIGSEEKEEVLRTIDSGWLSTGPKTRLFEEKVKEYFEDDHLEVIAVSSCTAGMHLQLLAAGIGPGDEVITSPLTFCSTINAILYTGARPVLVDIDPFTFNIDIEAIEEKITPRTKAIMPVYYAGQAVDHHRLHQLAKQYRLYILADAAHAMGAKYDGKYCGTYEDSAAFSFYATKNMTTGEGGLITTHNQEWAAKIRRLLLHGMNKDAWKRYSQAGSWYYEVTDLGYKYNFTDMQAALGIHQLAKIDHFNQIRRRYGDLYDQAFKDVPGIRLHGLDPKAYYTRHLYPIVIDESSAGINRQELIDKLREAKIGTSVHYIPIHYHPLYQERLGVQPGDYPTTEQVFQGLVSLPLYTKMQTQDVQRVVKRIKEVIHESTALAI